MRDARGEDENDEHIDDCKARFFFPSCLFFQRSLYYNHGYGAVECWLCFSLFLVYLTKEKEHRWNEHQRRP